MCDVTRQVLAHIAPEPEFRNQMSVKRPLVMNQPQIGQLVRELRLSIGLTQEQFAAHLGVTCGSINRWENGRSEPLPLARQQIWQCIEQMGARGEELLQKYLAN